jgi:hypothetical protein
LEVLGFTPTLGQSGVATEGQTTTKNARIHQQENGSLGKSHCSSFGTHYMGVTSYVLYHDKCATSTKCYATNLVDTQ